MELKRQYTNVLNIIFTIHFRINVVYKVVHIFLKFPRKQKKGKIRIRQACQH